MRLVFQPCIALQMYEIRLTGKQQESTHAMITVIELLTTGADLVLVKP
jgi:hypothetical protein